MRYIKPLVISVVAMSAFGGLARADEMRSASTTIDDAAITASLKTKLIGDKDTKANQINIETRNGVVQLNGFVDSTASRSEAERLASATDGVKTVKNNLEVRPGTRTATRVVDDGAITAKVNAALAADSRTSSLRIDVEANEGDVQLSGFAKNSEEKMAAAEVAGGVSGVRTVKNSLSVR